MTEALIIEDLVLGTGELACAGKSLSVNFTGWLADGQVFDTTANRDGPLWFPLGQGYVIKGWDDGIPGMRVGGKRRLTIRPELAYGDAGYGHMIPPHATLVFEVELIQIH
jgi:FKBP-type peptidyl-prolyl cis-trans isomerase FkpA